MPEPKTVCRTPTPGKKPTRIPTWKFDAVRTAILNVLPAKEPGVVAKDLPVLVEKRLDADVLAKLGSVGWHTTSVKLELEVAGEIRRVPGLKPQHLVRCAGRRSKGRG